MEKRVTLIGDKPVEDILHKLIKKYENLVIVSDSLTPSARDSEVFAIEHRLKLQRFSHKIEVLRYASGGAELLFALEIVL